MRDGILAEFVWLSAGELQRHYESNEHSPSVAPVGGYQNEPELEVLRDRFKNVECAVVGNSQESDILLDLNSNEKVQSRKIDSVLCNQVIEHIWNHSAFFNHLKEITAEVGLIWLGSPTSNFEHGSPSYFSPGFTSAYLERNLSHVGFTILASGQIASRRSYLMRHEFLHWISAAQATRHMLFPIGHFFKTNASQKLATLLSLTIPNSSKYVHCVESFVLGAYLISIRQLIPASQYPRLANSNTGECVSVDSVRAKIWPKWNASHPLGAVA